ncbi:MAG: flagellar protein FlhE [Halomonas sp.]|uniref:flagellar protein FlhE n=1 Tax=Halomonas sp. TaxID=1486246 RepID=UPI001A05A753|nr:flagellar protein FlhE [Halomonas sp.]MBE0489542.1 flagellar protein FlhE [Halomonas sp.]
MRAPAWGLMLALAWLAPAAQTLAAGSWVGQAGPVRAVMAERSVASAPMPAPSAVKAGVIEEVRWRYGVPAGKEVQGWLCHPVGCAELASLAGTSRALSGLPATTPLHFRFALAPGQRAAVQVGDLQVIVNYR